MQVIDESPWGTPLTSLVKQVSGEMTILSFYEEKIWCNISEGTFVNGLCERYYRILRFE